MDRAEPYETTIGFDVQPWQRMWDEMPAGAKVPLALSPCGDQVQAIGSRVFYVREQRVWGVEIYATAQEAEVVARLRRRHLVDTPTTNTEEVS